MPLAPDLHVGRLPSAGVHAHRPSAREDAALPPYRPTRFKGLQLGDGRVPLRRVLLQRGAQLVAIPRSKLSASGPQEGGRRHHRGDLP
jgi:hypothetical protein